MNDDELIDHFRDCVLDALEKFRLRFSSIELKKDTSFDIRIIQFDTALYAGCLRKGEDDGGETIVFSFSEGLIQALAADLSMDDRDSQIFVWRVFWIVHHEIAHWLYGHLPFYKSQGWVSEIGISEAALASVDLNGDGSDRYRLARVAELAADIFAINQLYAEIAQHDLEGSLPAGDDPARDDFDLDAGLCYYVAFSTVALFYAARSSGASVSLLHPSWSIRAVNLLRALFNDYFAAVSGIPAEPGATYDNDAIRPFVLRFIEKALRTPMEAVEEFAQRVSTAEGLNFHAGEGNTGLFEPASFLRVMSGSTEIDPLTEELKKLYAAGDELIDMTQNLLPVEGLKLNRAYGDTRMNEAAPEEKVTVRSELGEAESEAIIARWARDQNLAIVSVKQNKAIGADEFSVIIDIVFKVLNELGPEGVRASVRILLAMLKKKDIP